MQPMPIHQSREPSPEDSAWESTAAQRTPPGRIFRLWIRSTCSRYPQRNIIHDGVFFPVATETGRSLTFPNPSEFSNMSYMLGRRTSKPPWCLAGIGASAKSCKNRSAALHDTQQIQAGIQFQFPRLQNLGLFHIVSLYLSLFHIIRNHPVDHALEASLPLHLQVLRVCRGQQKRHGNFWELAASDIMLSNSGLRKGAWVDSLACRIWEVCPSEFALNSNQFISRGFNPSQQGSMLESWSQVRYIETTIKISVVCPETGTSKESKAFSPRIHNQPEIVGLLGFVRSGTQFSDSSLLYDGINQQELGLKCYQLIL